MTLIKPPFAAGANDPNARLAQILPNFKPETRAQLQAVLTASDFSGCIPAAAARSMAASEHKAVSDLMLALLPVAREFSHPPISNYRVGTVAQGASGNLYLGFNVEIPGQALGFAVHGEQAACSSAYMHGEAGITSIAVTAAPCGHCRQFMTELAPDGELAVLVDGAAPTKLSSLLPASFGPRDLGRKEGAFPVRATDLHVPKNADALVQAACDAARKSYAPYSNSHSGVALQGRSGKIFRGSYIENVAFNPSLPPLQTALVQLILAGEDYKDIVRAVLAEKADAQITQRQATEAVLGAVGPGVRLETAAVL